ADGNFDVQYITNAIVNYAGKVTWFPPAIYKSACKINIEHFPFDEQNCKMKFGPWSHDSSKINMTCDRTIVDQEDYWPNGEWEIMESPGQANIVAYPCCPDEYYADVTYRFILHRKPLFYVVTLVVPCLLISFLTILVFYLPSDAQEKVTLSVSILLALIVFLLLIPNLIPPTSTTLPLIGRYMLFTMVLVTLSITITVVVINIHFRTSSTHVMPMWSRVVFLKFLPKLLCIKRPMQEKGSKKKYRALKKVKPPFSSIFTSISSVFKKEKEDEKPSTYVLESITPSLLEEIESRDREFDESLGGKPLQQDCMEIIDNIEVIVKHMQAEDEMEEISDDWKFMATVIDRLFLWVFTITCLSGTFGIILRAPMLWEAPDHHPVENYTRPTVVENQSYDELVALGKVKEGLYD
ncbi:putative neuronal acetylcholine receptor subunit alpha-3, partial [Apostichopus japonicus]